LNLNQYPVLIIMIRLVFLEVVTQSWLRKKTHSRAREQRLSRVLVQNMDVDVDVDEDEDEEE
jgi:hypothetical protein